MDTTRSSGQTLIEVLLVTGVMALLLTALVSVMTTSIARNRLSQERSVAVRLAQEGVEWFRGERDRLGWNQFISELGSSTNICLPDASVAVDDNAEMRFRECDVVSYNTDYINQIYWRDLVLYYQNSSPNAPEHYEVMIRVDWNGNNGSPVEVSTEVARPL
jgi:type II secretory pathway pseudopilin PulG